MSVSLAMVALDDAALPNFDALQSFLAQKWEDVTCEDGWKSDEPDQDDPTENEDDGTTLFFTVNGQKAVVALMPGPIPWGDLEGPCETSVLWPEAKQVLKSHTHHWLVTLMSDGLEPIEESTLLTQILAATLESPHATGVYYGNATLVVQPKLFQDMASLLPETYPIFTWIDFRVGPNESGSVSGFTAGMKALGHMEIECENATDEVGDFRERLLNLCDYLLQNGPVIQDGHTVGSDANERIRVRIASSAFGHEGQVMRLDYEPVTKKPWWKFF